MSKHKMIPGSIKEETKDYAKIIESVYNIVCSAKVDLSSIIESLKEGDEPEHAALWNLKYKLNTIQKITGEIKNL
jgi:hypothetical protein